jgi:predicted phosphodiesterase
MKKRLIFGAFIAFSLASCTSPSISNNGTSSLEDSSTVSSSETIITKEFDDENIVMTAAVISDPHVGFKDTKVDNNVTFRNTLNTLKRLNGDKDFDVLLSAGDNTQNGTKEEVKQFMDIYKSTYDINKTPLFFCHGNHDTYWSGCMSTTGFYDAYGEDVYKNDLDQTAAKLGNRHMKVNGIHLVALQMSTYQPGNNTFTPQTETWVKQTLDAIKLENPLQPVIVLGHSPVSNTVHGSFDENDTGNWGSSKQLGTLLSDYSNVILLSGHTHYDFYHSKSIAQDKFTAIQIPSSSDLDLDNNYSDQVKDLANRREYSFGAILEVDNLGNIRFTRYDLKKEEKILNSWVIPSPKQDNSHLDKYNLQIREANNLAPSFEGKNITLTYDKENHFSLSFDVPADDDIILAYKARIYIGSEEDIYDPEDYIEEFVYLDDYYNYPQGKQKVDLKIDGVYSRRSQWTVKLAAIDSFDKQSEFVTHTELIDLA